MDDFAVDEINVLNVDEVDALLINEAGEESFEPSKGMEFSSQKAAYDFYNTYAYIAGFSIRLRNSYKNTKGITTSIRLVCSKEGSTIPQQHQLVKGLATDGGSIQKTPEKKTSSKRSSCQALCQVRLHKDGIWRVTSLQKDHNHELLKNTPSKKRHLRSHKRISMEERADIELLNEQNVGNTQIREYLAGKAKGRVNLHFSKKDVNNQIANAKRKLVGVDVNAMIDFFKRRQQEDQDFFFVIEPDEDNAAKNIFWVDGRSRRAYQEFGEVVVFDTTYSTNRCSMPMGPFIGVNHHRQSIFFGCALIRDEKKTTFFWLFQTWLEAMGGKKPLVIFTDQDLAMRAAIKKVFGADTTHRCCMWHVMKNATDHLGKLYGLIEGFKDELADVITLSLTVSDFETNWHYVLKKYKMEDNSHLKQMFEKRDEWAPAYFRDAFCAGMSTTQRGESINAVTKIWMGSNTSLYDFATRFEKMVESVYERESDEDIRTMNATPQLWACHPIEVQARQVYTRNIFSLFKDKLKRCTALSICEIEKERLYEVSPVTIKYKYEWYKPNRMVLIDKTNGRVDCECKGFQFQGVLCSHALEVMRFVKMQPFLPAHYILKRWTRDANASIKRGTNKNNLKGKSDLQSVMRNALTQRVERIVEAVKSRAAYDMACTKLDELEEGIAKIEQGVEQAPHTTHNAMVEKNSSESLQFQYPPVSQCKGKRKAQRLKPPAEAKKGMRMCSYCHRKEGHNSSTCPEKMLAESSFKGQTQAFGVHDHEDNIEYNNKHESENDNMSTCPKKMLAESSFKGQTQAFGVHDHEDNNKYNNECESENDNLY